jgi:hypothetical protein
MAEVGKRGIRIAIDVSQLPNAPPDILLNY